MKKRQTRTARTAACAVLAVAAATVAGVLAQGPAPVPAQATAGTVRPDWQPPVAVRASTVVEARITTGRPYSAEATTEFTQTLGDGNKIVRKSTVRIYRDNDGRTRREELGADGSLKSVSIYDPVAHVTYVLDPVNKTAHKSSVRVATPTAFVTTTDEEKRRIETRVMVERDAGSQAAGTVTLMSPAELPAKVPDQKREVEVTARGRVAVQPLARTRPDGKEESLGQRLVEGVMADGKRVTTVLPAGAIGNQAPITVVSEQWFSPDLEILLLTTHSDPRAGYTTYTLTNVIRAEPQAGLFDLPADYTVVGSSYMRYPAQR